MKSVKRSRAVIFSRTRIWKSVTGSILTTAMLATAQQANAGAELKLGDESGVTVGFGIRSSYTSVENGAPNGTSRSNDFAVENARLYMSGHYGKIIKATFNTERTGGSAAT